MNNDDLITAVRESVTSVHTTTPVEQIIRRGHAVRARRQILGLAGGVAVTVAAVAALAGTVVAPGSHQASHQAGHQASHQHTVRLAAWTVTQQANGNIAVTIRKLQDPAGLQGMLRADGVPASVTFSDQQNASCQPYPATQAQLDAVFTGLPPMQAPVPAPVPPAPRLTVVVIHPSALPNGTGVQLAAFFGPHGQVIIKVPSLVYASPRCTGS